MAPITFALILALFGGLRHAEAPSGRIGASDHRERTLRFIGNNGFELSDGTSTILLDFPYISGAHGYMRFDARELRHRPASLCLFTHRHADHFDPAAIEDIGCQVAGPREVTSQVPPSRRLPGNSPWRMGGVTGECLPTVHQQLEHCTLIVRWHGRVIVSLGDIESLDGLVERLPRPDILLVPVWFVRRMQTLSGAFPAAAIYLTHAEPGAVPGACLRCRQLQQGESVAW
jgi:L-ascorbate metabolism protein UlaG (beta-lactamase superfamily)